MILVKKYVNITYIFFITTGIRVLGFLVSSETEISFQMVMGVIRLKSFGKIEPRCSSEAQYVLAIETHPVG